MATKNSPQLITNGLVLALDAGNIRSYPGSGAAFSDLSSANNNATLVNSPTYSTNNLGYFTFNGTTQSVTIPYSSTLDFATALTVSFWFYSGTVFTDPANSISGAYLKGRSDLDLYNPLFQIDGYYVWTGAGGRAQYKPPAGFVVANTWYNLVVTHVSGSAPNVYLNGAAAVGYTFFEGDGTRVLGTNGSPVTINGDTQRGTVGNFNGQIAALHTYNRALSADEVLQNFNAFRGRFGL